MRIYSNDKYALGYCESGAVYDIDFAFSFCRKYNDYNPCDSNGQLYFAF